VEENTLMTIPGRRDRGGREKKKSPAIQSESPLGLLDKSPEAAPAKSAWFQSENIHDSFGGQFKDDLIERVALANQHRFSELGYDDVVKAAKELFAGMDFKIVDPDNPDPETPIVGIQIPNAPTYLISVSECRETAMSLA